MSAHRYGSAGEALKDLEDSYNYWSGKITESSTAFALGLIAANWAVHGSAGLKTLLLPRLSVFCALALLLVGLVIAQMMSNEHDRIHQEAENNPEQWERDYLAAKMKKNDPWPYSAKVECIGLWGRRLKVLLQALPRGTREKNSFCFSAERWPRSQRSPGKRSAPGK